MAQRWAGKEANGQAMTPTADQIADRAIKFLGARTMLTTGTREEFRQLLIRELEPLAPNPQPRINFDVTAGKHGGNSESVKAAKDGQSRRADQRRRVWTYLHEHGGATCWEISQAIQMPYQTCSARCADLKADGMIRKTGETRKTPTGSAAAVLVTI